LLAGTYSSSNSNDGSGSSTTTHSSLDDLSDMILEHEYTETEWDVILGVTGLVLGMCLVCCLCGQKVVKRHRRKKQQQAKNQMLVDGGDGTQPGESENIPVSRKQSIKEMVKTAAAGTKLVVKEAASKAASIVRGDKNKKNSSKIDDNEGELEGGYVDVGDSTNEVSD
jgi:hypothetical protein